MANSYKILGQIAPTQNTLSNVYVTGASVSSVVNTIYICNQSAANANVDIVVRPINETLANKHYILQNQLIDAADTLILNLNITMNASVILAANSESGRAGEANNQLLAGANVSISAFGVEIS
jgi:hypothetical protein